MNEKRPSVIFLLIIAFFFSVFGNEIKYVIHISVDGLRADVIPTLGPEKLPNFHRLKNEGISTFNARPDADNNSTLPNHLSMVLGRPVKGNDGHNWTRNGDVSADMNIHDENRQYISSVFDVAHDNGLRTALFAGKSKFSLIKQSFNKETGRDDIVGEDNGNNKIDKFTCFYQNNSRTLNWLFINEMINNPFNYSLLHYADPDKYGHKYSWDITEGSKYVKSIELVDALIGDLMDIIESVDILKNKTAIILTADHGGHGYSHGDLSKPSTYTIPFMVWGPGITVGSDLYAINRSTRKDPGTDIISYDYSHQPIRNNDAPNLALMLLGLPAISGSVINSNQNLYVKEQTTPINVVEQNTAAQFSIFGNDPIHIYSLNGQHIKTLQPQKQTLGNLSVYAGLTKGIYILKNDLNRKVLKVSIF